MSSAPSTTFYLDYSLSKLTWLLFSCYVEGVSFGWKFSRLLIRNIVCFSDIYRIWSILKAVYFIQLSVNSWRTLTNLSLSCSKANKCIACHIHFFEFSWMCDNLWIPRASNEKLWNYTFCIRRCDIWLNTSTNVYVWFVWGLAHFEDFIIDYSLSCCLFEWGN